MPWDNKNNGPRNGGNNPWGKKTVIIIMVVIIGILKIREMI